MRHAWLLLAGYTAVIFAAALFGGWLPSRVRVTHARTHLAMSLVAGLILGVALYHMVPHSVTRLGGPAAATIVAWWMVLGMVCMVLLLRVLPFHQHDIAGSEGGRSSRLGWVGIALGMSLHSLVEGVALGVSMLDGGDADSGLLASGVFLAICLHKPLDSLAIAGTMRADGVARRARRAVGVGFAVVCPAAAFATFWGVGLMGVGMDAALGRAMAFSAGAFLCVSLGDILPEIHFHSHDRGKLALAFLVGIGLAYGMHALESDALHGA